MNEIICSLHNYTKFSGYKYSFYDLAQAALDCCMDAVITTDKNIYPSGRDQFYYRAEKRMLLICGEELYDPISPDSQRYLSLGISKEQFNRRIGLRQDEIRVMIDDSYRNNDFHHIELINAEDILRKGISSGLRSIRTNLRYYDELLKTDQKFIGIAGTCSIDHTEIYSYPELFSTVKNHIIAEEDLNGDFDHDRNLLMKYIKTGRLYIGLDGIADATGFSFSAEGSNQDSAAWPGDTIYLKNSITFKINIPESCTCRLIKDGNVIKEWMQCKQVPFTIYEPGFYRVECSLTIRRNVYDWIFSDPIFVVKG